MTPFEWFAKRYGEPTPAQGEAWPRIAARSECPHRLAHGHRARRSPRFSACSTQLAALHAQRRTAVDTIHCVYVSPLRALSYDLEKNLAEPLREIYGEKPPIRVELRTGDTTSRPARAAIRPAAAYPAHHAGEPLRAAQPGDWLRLWRTVRWVIVDEIHALAENKRGAISRSSAGAARARHRGQRSSASASPRPSRRWMKSARFLTGTHGRVRHRGRFHAPRKSSSASTRPLRKNPYPEAGYTGQRLIRELGAAHSRPPDHAGLHQYPLRRRGHDLLAARDLARISRTQIECHHASLDRDVRREVEDRLKRGELRAVVCSTSLELGIDIGSVDLVVMMSTPKGVSKALQRAGRAGHNIHADQPRHPHGDERQRPRRSPAPRSCSRATRHLDYVRLPRIRRSTCSPSISSAWAARALDAATRRSRWCARAYPFRDLDADDFDDVLDYLAGGGEALRQQYAEVFGKIDLDADGFRTRDGPRPARLPAKRRRHPETSARSASG